MMKSNIIHIKNMVCNRCIMVVTEALKRMGFTPLSVELGTAILQEPINAEERAAIKPALEAYGFELIDDKRMRIIEQIKVAVIELVHYNDNSSKTNLSDYLTDKCHHDYSFLSKLFSEVNGISIEKYYIIQKIELVAHHINFSFNWMGTLSFQRFGNGTGQIIIYEILPAGVEISKK